MKLFRSLQVCALVGASLFTISPKASAVPLSYTVSSLDAPDAPGGSGLTVNTFAPPSTFTLSNPGEGTDFFDFPFFTVTVDNSSGGSFGTNVSAIINFADPAGQGATFNGTFSSSFPILIFLQLARSTRQIAPSPST